MVASGRTPDVVSWFGFVLISVLVLQSTPASAAPDPKAARPTPATAALEQAVNSVGEQQKAQAATIAELRAQLSDLQRSLAELRDENRQKQESGHATSDQTLTQVKEMREEVRGLYVESSGIKGDVVQAAKQVEGLDANLSSFRLSAGIIVALIIALQLVLMGLTFRSRG